MSLFGISEKKEIERLKAQLSPDQRQLDEVGKQVMETRAELKQLQEQLQKTRRDLAEAKQQIIETDEAALLQSFGIYTPHYSYSTSDEYKEKIKEVRDKQKAAIKNGQAVAGNENWQVNGSSAKGKKMVHDMQKLLLRAYNAECDDAIEQLIPR